MSDLNFNIYAFARPSTSAERSELLIEALRMADELLEMIQKNTDYLEKHIEPLAA